MFQLNSIHLKRSHKTIDVILNQFPKSRWLEKYSISEIISTNGKFTPKMKVKFAKLP